MSSPAIVLPLSKSSTTDDVSTYSNIEILHPDGSAPLGLVEFFFVFVLSDEVVVIGGLLNVSSAQHQ